MRPLSVGWLWSQHCCGTACAPLEVFSLILYSLQLLETFGITSTTKQTNILTLVMVIANQKKKILRWCNKSPKFVTHTGKNVTVDHNWDYCSPNSITRYTSCGDLNIPHHLHVSKFGFPWSFTHYSLCRLLASPKQNRANKYLETTLWQTPLVKRL